jgi:AraC-like ligand binding domain
MSGRSNNFYQCLPVAKRDVDWGLYITSVGASHSGPELNHLSSGGRLKTLPVQTVKHSLQEYRVIYISAGSGWFKIAGSPRKQVEAGQIILLFPGLQHSSAPNAASGWSQHWIDFDGDLAWRLRQHGFFITNQPIQRVGDQERFRALFNDSIMTVRRNPPAVQQILAGITISILSMYYSVQHFGSRGDKLEIKIIRNAIAHMHESHSPII